MDRVYLDWNATAPLRPEAKAAMLAAWEAVGNPSSVHAEGRAARGILDRARRSVGDATGAAPADVIFTSGGTEANSLALSIASHERILVSAVEHSSVLANAPNAQMIAVTSDGLVDLADLEAKIASLKPALISIMLANNETGVIQPVAEAGELARQSGALLHVDCVPAFGKIPLNMKDLNADLLTLSAHKIGGPQGVGALVIGPRAQALKAMIRGGGQEFGRRAGTENVPGVAGFAAAIDRAVTAREPDMIRIAVLKASLEAELTRNPEVAIVSAAVPRLPTTTLFAHPRLSAETALMRFDLAGIAVSSGSACSSGKVQPSHVLTAMNYPKRMTRSAIRVSMGWTTTERDVVRFLEAWRSLEGALLKAHETVLERF